MPKDLYRVLVAQFLTAFADNAVLFTAITMVMVDSSVGSWYIPALQAAFLLAFVVLGPWVGRYADAYSKPKVMLLANVIKGSGVALLIAGLEPLLAFIIIGTGAALYSPAKYGILPELVDAQVLVKANGWIEGSTIIAILSGTLVGAALSEYSINFSLFLVMLFYIASAVVAKLVVHSYVVGRREGAVLKGFFMQMKRLLRTPRARFSTLGVSLFWSAATVLRLLLVAWAPVVLLMTSTTDIALLTMFVAFGIAVGAVLVPRLIPMAYLRRARLAAYGMGMVIIVLSMVGDAWLARLALFMAGVCGGLFVVPINAALQEIGHKTIGSGGAVAIQNFFENFAMLLASGTYALIAGAGVDPVATMIWLGVLVVILTVLVSWRLPKDTGELQG